MSDDLDKYLDTADMSTMPERYIKGGIVHHIESNTELEITKDVLQIMCRDPEDITDDDRSIIEDLFSQFDSDNWYVHVRILPDTEKFKKEVRETAEELINTHMR